MLERGCDVGTRLCWGLSERLEEVKSQLNIYQEKQVRSSGVETGTGKRRRVE
jgi:hypothetical protein